MGGYPTVHVFWPLIQGLPKAGTLCLELSHIHTYIPTYIHTCMHTYIHTYIQIYINIYTYVYICIYALIHQNLVLVGSL